MNPQTRRKLAVFALFLGLIFIVGAQIAVFSGATEPWALVFLLPVLLVMRRVYNRYLADPEQK